MAKQADSLNKVFPTWFKKLKVTFTGEIPTTDKARQQFLEVSYPLFEAALNEWAKQQMLKAELEQAIKYRTLFESGLKDFGSDSHTKTAHLVILFDKEIAELRQSIGGNLSSEPCLTCGKPEGHARHVLNQCEYRGQR